MDSKLDMTITLMYNKFTKLTVEQSPIFQKCMLKYLGVKNYNACNLPQVAQKKKCACGGGGGARERERERE